MKKIFSLILGILVVFISVNKINAALPNKLGGIKQQTVNVKDNCGNSSCYAMPLKVYTIVDGQSTTAAPIICTYYKGAVPVGKVVTKDNTNWTNDIRYGVGAVIQSAVDSGKINNSSVTVEYFAAEMAINKFLNENNAGGHNYTGGLSATYSGKYEEYLNIARNAKNNYDVAKSINMTLSTNELIFTLNGNNYESNSITINGVSEYSITSNIGEISKSGNSFKVVIGADKISSKTEVAIEVSSSKTLKYASNYIVNPTEENNNTDQCTILIGEDEEGNDIFETKKCQSVTPAILEEETSNTVKLNATGTITPEPEKGKIIINKFDNNNQYLAGVKIKVTGPNNYDNEFTTNTTSINLINLEFGTYTIEEIETPQGYVTASKQIVTLDKNNLEKIVTLINNRTKVKISKVDATGKKELPGATLEIQDKDGKIVKYCTDDKGNANTDCKWVSTDKPYEIEGLPIGKYYLVETISPKGYVLNKEKVEFEITDTATIKTVVMKNKFTKVKISKVDATGKKELPGSTLEVQDEDGNIVKYCTDDKGNLNVDCKWVSTDKPYEIEGLPTGKYYLVETIAPKGYVLNKEKVEFEVKKDSSIIEVKMKNDLEVEVPDTLSSRSALLLTIAMFDVALGIGILTYVKKNKEGNN